MTHTVAFVLAATGGGLLGAMFALWHQRTPRLKINTAAAKAKGVYCEAPSPNARLSCREELGHYGWHRQGQSSWWGTAWAHGAPSVAPKLAEVVVVKPAPKPAPKPTPTPKPKPPVDVDALAAVSWAPAVSRASAAPSQPLRSGHADRSIIGPKPLKFRIGMFGTRYPIEEPST